MDQENSLEAKKSEMENSIIRTRQKEVCEISRSCFLRRPTFARLSLSFLILQRWTTTNVLFSILNYFVSQKQAENVLKQTKKTELMLIAKYQSLQKYTLELTEREARIAKERLDVNQEKLELQSQRKKLFETRCSLCKIGEKANELKGIIQKDPTDFDDINSANNEQLNMENFSSTSGLNFGSFYNQDLQLLPSVDLENVPNLTDMSDDFLDSDLLMLKFDLLNSNRNNSNYKDF